MSPQNHFLNESKIKDKNDPAPGGILDVIIQASGEPRISPGTITLTNKVHTVHWRCVGLARGERLQIHFPQDPQGPFLELESFQQVPEEVNGYGNRGPEEASKEYEYEARIIKQRKILRATLGHLNNKATIVVNHPHAGGTGDPPTEPLKPPK